MKSLWAESGTTVDTTPTEAAQRTSHTVEKGNTLMERLIYKWSLVNDVTSTKKS